MYIIIFCLTRVSVIAGTTAIGSTISGVIGVLNSLEVRGSCV